MVPENNGFTSNSGAYSCGWQCGDWWQENGTGRVPQRYRSPCRNAGILPEFTGKKNLQLLGMLQEGVTEEDIEEAMNAVGLDPKDRRHYKKYSLGMKERLGIAQAILKKPKLILLDEPTNGIDSDGIQMLEELLRRLKEAGSTIVVTSHDRDFLDAVTSQCYEMKEGSLR